MNVLNKRNLGKTNLVVSEIGLGGWQLGGYTSINEIPITFGDVSEQMAVKIIKEALNLGINTFDTSDYYSMGNSERVLGKVLKDYRSEVNIFTKGGVIPSLHNDKTFEIDLSYEYLISALRRSLNRLQIEYIDLFQTHKTPKTEKDFDNIEKAFNKIKADNIARYCGASIGVEYDMGIKLIQRGIVDSLQIYFSLIDPKPIKELLPFAKKNNVGIIVAEPLAQGFLTGKYNPDHIFLNIDIRSQYDKEFVKTRLERVKEFEFLVNEHRSLNQAVLAYLLHKTEISTCVPGSRNIEQLESNVAASKIRLSGKELDQILTIQEKWLN